MVLHLPSSHYKPVGHLDQDIDVGIVEEVGRAVVVVND